MRVGVNRVRWPPVIRRRRGLAVKARVQGEVTSSVLDDLPARASMSRDLGELTPNHLNELL